jgi:hypothetical protein
MVSHQGEEEDRTVHYNEINANVGEPMQAEQEEGLYLYTDT